jgi:hypothetical protein
MDAWQALAGPAKLAAGQRLPVQGGAGQSTAGAVDHGHLCGKVVPGVRPGSVSPGNGAAACRERPGRAGRPA